MDVFRTPQRKGAELPGPVFNFVESLVVYLGCVQNDEILCKFAASSLLIWT
jgi:hypothetical protein